MMDREAVAQLLYKAAHPGEDWTVGPDDHDKAAYYAMADALLAQCTVTAIPAA
jgi:hypothetical protein